MVEKDSAPVSPGFANLKDIERDDGEEVETLDSSEAFVDEVIFLHGSDNFQLSAALDKVIPHCDTTSVVKDAGNN